MDGGMAAEPGLGGRPAGAERGRQPQPQPRCAERELSPVTDRRSLLLVLCSGAERGRSRRRLCTHLSWAQLGCARGCGGAEIGGSGAGGRGVSGAALQEEGAEAPRVQKQPRRCLQHQQPHTDTPSPGRQGSSAGAVLPTFGAGSGGTNPAGSG